MILERRQEQTKEEWGATKGFYLSKGETWPFLDCEEITWATV